MPPPAAARASAGSDGAGGRPLWWEPVNRMDQVFKAYDVRGTVPDQLDADMCRAIGRAMARFADAPEILVARDMRESGVELSGAFSDGVRAEGVDVTDLGMASTDFMYFASGHLDAPGAMFTASHNPAQYNGLKLCLSGARPIGRDTGLGDIEAEAEKLLGEPMPPLRGTRRELDLLGAWADHVVSFVDLSSLRPLKVVADTANGMGGLVVPIVFDRLPFSVEILFPELDGTFPNHPADPIQPENLVALKRGGDRAGRRHRPRLRRGRRPRLPRRREGGTGVGLADDRARGGVHADQAPRRDDPLQPHLLPRGARGRDGDGRHPVRTQVGHSIIKKVMAETGAVFGGEHSGHYYYRDNFRADSGIITALVVLELLSRSGEPLSAMLEPYQRYADSGEINTEVTSPAATVAALAEHERAAGASIDLLDGLTVEHDDWWYNVRPSNTEPLLRLNVEAKTPERCAAHVAEMRALIAAYAGAAAGPN